jgi:hypothetical protein
MASPKESSDKGVSISISPEALMQIIKAFAGHEMGEGAEGGEGGMQPTTGATGGPGATAMAPAPAGPQSLLGGGGGPMPPAAKPSMLGGR